MTLTLVADGCRHVSKRRTWTSNMGGVALSAWFPLKEHNLPNDSFEYPCKSPFGSIFMDNSALQLDINGLKWRCRHTSPHSLMANRVEATLSWRDRPKTPDAGKQSKASWRIRCSPTPASSPLLAGFSGRRLRAESAKICGTLNPPSVPMVDLEPGGWEVFLKFPRHQSKAWQFHAKQRALPMWQLLLNRLLSTG